MKIITESNFNVNVEKDSKKNLYIEGVFALSETKNENGRIYPKELLEREVDKINKGSVANSSCLGELEHPTERAQTLLERAAIMTDKLEWNNNEVHGRAKVLENVPAGYTLKGLLESGVSVGISSRGLGETKFDESRQSEIVTDSYNLLCWDCVQNPSTGSFVKGILEGKEFNLPTDTKQPSYQEIKQFLFENEINFDPIRISELIKEGYSLDEVKDILEKVQDEHYKRIWQVLESL